MKNINVAVVLMLCVVLGSCKAKSQVVQEAEQTPQRPAKTENRQQGPPPNTADMITKMDTDRDGMLSKSEVKGPLANDFDKIDLNGDGKLSIEELEKAPKPNRQGPPRQ